MAADARVELANERVKAVCVYHFTNPQYKVGIVMECFNKILTHFD